MRRDVRNLPQPVPKGKGISVIIWGGFCSSERCNLVVMDRDKAAKRGGYSANSYLNVLEQAIPTIYEPGLLFMQDNASIHTVYKVQA